jgi:hypothetical protein
VTRNRPIVEELAKDTLDMRELNRAGLLADDWVTLLPSLRWPRIATMRLARYRILLELRNQSVGMSVGQPQDSPAKASVPQQQIPACYEICDASKDDGTDTRRHYQIERWSERSALSLFLLHADGVKCGRCFFACRW